MTNDKKQEALEAIRWPMKALKQEEARLHGYVTVARNEGASWSEIGAVLGTTKQAAQQRFGAQEAISEAIRRTKPKELAMEEDDPYDIDSPQYWGGAD
ncbi:hypothetical protein [Pseudarthrobacter siccitolerans]